MFFLVLTLQWIYNNRMNWLVVSNNKNKEFVSFLKTKVKEIKFFEFDENFINFDDLKKVSHCVIFENPSDFEKETSFLYGFLCGKNIPIYIISKEKKSFDFPNTLLFEDVSLFNDYLNSNFCKIQENFSKKEAFNFLYENGIPFDADNFASCIASGKMDICKYYLAAGMSVDSRDRDGTPMLNIAARNDRLDFVQWLVEQGADINAVSEDRGYTAIMDAVWRGNIEITEYLIKKGSDLNTINKEGQSMLVLAVGANRTQICKILAENGANPDIPDAMGMSAYGYAKLFKKVDIVSILEKYHKE